MRADEQGEARAPERPPIRRYEDIEAYQRSMQLLSPLHRLVRTLPVYETYELGSQLRRASKSVPANIAEGYGKKRSIKEFKAYLNNALGSANEVVAHLKIAEALEYASADDVGPLIDGYTIVAKQLHRLIQRWQGFTPPGRWKGIPLLASRFQKTRHLGARHEHNLHDQSVPVPDLRVGDGGTPRQAVRSDI